uniref:Venom serpin 1 n=1 Tax=Platymeris rhadamanthus TaxID=1134088 RepID=A0A6B9KZG0_PLARH|nr:venom serpin 1 [Platymeris rhadamanthus]
MVSIKLTALTLLGAFLIFTMPATTSSSQEPSQDDVKALQAITEGSNKFAIDLYQAIKKPGENIIVSPISAQIVLALAYTGAKENTAKELANVLHLPDNIDEVLRGHKLLIQHLENPVLKLATKMFIEKTLEVKPEFQQNAANYFLSDAGLVSFVKDPEGARKEINHWVEQKTNDKIKDLLAEGSIDPLTRMVLTNAIHFKANWESKFDPDLTEDGDFFVTPENKVKVKMMMKKKKFPFRMHQELDAKILEMPYAGNEFKMIIILPNKIDGLAEVENKLASSDLSELLRGLHEVEVNVKLPRFKIEKTMELKDILIGMGIKDIFDEAKANLTGISNEHLYASKVVQKAFIEVNEEGTEAAAATALVMVAYSSLVIYPQEDFHADHPFLYILKKDNMITFMGSVKST